MMIINHASCAHESIVGTVTTIGVEDERFHVDLRKLDSALLSCAAIMLTISIHVHVGFRAGFPWGAASMLLLLA